VTKAELDEIKACAAAATPGPLHVREGEEDFDYVLLTERSDTPVLIVPLTRDAPEDLAFYLRARTDVPRLIAALEEAWERIAELEDYRFRYESVSR
jgi:hypothetical protein